MSDIKILLIFGLVALGGFIAGFIFAADVIIGKICKGDNDETTDTDS